MGKHITCTHIHTHPHTLASVFLYCTCMYMSRIASPHTIAIEEAQMLPTNDCTTRLSPSKASVQAVLHVILAVLLTKHNVPVHVRASVCQFSIIPGVYTEWAHSQDTGKTYIQKPRRQFVENASVIEIWPVVLVTLLPPLPLNTLVYRGVYTQYNMEPVYICMYSCRCVKQPLPYHSHFVLAPSIMYVAGYNYTCARQYTCKEHSMVWWVA